jgi:hypothetical protein
MSATATPEAPVKTAVRNTTARTPIFDASNPGFKKDFDEMPFEFEHCFTEDHPMFEFPRIRQILDHPELKHHAYYDHGEVIIGQVWKELPERKLTSHEVYDNILDCRGWMMLRHLEKDPEYNELLEQCLKEIKHLTGREIDQDKKSQEAIIFFTSPNRTTAYHIDRECNLLMQVRGLKEMNIFDRNDRDVTPETELESFWSKDNNAGKYKPEFQDRAFVYQMRPGTGVHIPVNSPHWLRTPNNISTSFSVSYQYKDTRRKHVYQANYYLRKMGLNPTPPGKSALLDNTKRMAVSAGFAGKNLVKKLKSKPAKSSDGKMGS